MIRSSGAARRSTTCLCVVVVTATACGGKTGTTQSTHDAGVDAARIDAANRITPSEKTDASGSDATPTRSTRCRPVTHVMPEGGLPHRPFYDGDAGPAPPEHCVAPCVWDAISRCIPTLRHCERESEVTAAGNLATCDCESGWTTFKGSDGPGRSVFEIRRDGALCFGVTTVIKQGGDPPTEPPVPRTTYSDDEGIFAFGIDGTVACGRLNSSTNPPSVELIGPGPYPIDRSTLECAPWDEFGLPEQPPCETMTEGLCPPRDSR